MAGSERFASGLLPYLHHHPAALSKLSLILHCYFPNRFSANFRQILLFSSLFVHQYFPGTSTSSSDSPLSLLRCFSPRNPPINAERQEHLFPNHQKSLQSNSGYRCFNSFHFSRNVSVVKYLPVIWSLPFTSSITVSPDLVFIFPAQQYKDQPLCCKYPWKSQSDPDLVWSCQKRCCYPKSSGRWSRRNPESCEDPDFSIQEPDL